ncbi:YxlC family protein [Rossellomorea aquimaris]|uniref:YxlC family protein n=1 Tax=Rossellomorea aquimaris TaxID=189382 RepID=UPI001CD8167F|nr:YxlC family protein [Rossellomorea aquimaris]MCA1059656.1 YxlC family protein [Rossellomorea aquimaris]
MKNDHEQDELMKLLDEGFRSIDDGIDQSTPSEQWFERFAKDQQEQLKKRFRRDLSVFILLACFILAMFFLTLFQMPVLFLLLQGAAFVGASIYTGITYVKKVKEI